MANFQLRLVQGPWTEGLNTDTNTDITVRLTNTDTDADRCVTPQRSIPCSPCMCSAVTWGKQQAK